MLNSKSQAGTEAQQSTKDEGEIRLPDLHKTNVSGSLLSDEAIEKYAIEKYKEVEDSRWFIPLQVGAKWARDILIKEIESKPMLSDEEMREPIENALYATKRFLTTQATELADGILDYLKDAGFAIVRNDH